MNGPSRFVVLAVCLAGCSEGIGPVPVSGYNFTPVSYAPQPVVNPTLLEIPPFDLSSPPQTPAILVFPDHVTPGFPIAVTGIVDQLQNTPADARIVLIECYQSMPDGRKRGTQSALTAVDPAEATDGAVPYRAELLGPKQPLGRHYIDVRLVRPGEEPGEGILLATGEFELVAE